MADVCDASAGGRPDNPLGDSREVTLMKVQEVIDHVDASGFLGEDREELEFYYLAKDFLLSLLEG